MKKMIGRIIKNCFKNTYGKIKYQRFYKYLYNLSLNGMNIGGGSDSDSNGEEFIINYLAKNFKGEKFILFDVGANIGDYTERAIKIFAKYEKNTEIHCFEPSKSTYESLMKNINQNRHSSGEKMKIIFNNFGISDRQNEAILYKDTAQSSLASLYKRELDHCNIKMEIEEKIILNTLDNYCAENQIERLDFLKLDIEGNEISALKGALKYIKSKKIKNIQFEFGGCNIDSRTYFKDFWELLKDYNIYRITKDGIFKIENYDERLECFSCTNYFAQSKQEIK